jgi:hypothetical protein
VIGRPEWPIARVDACRYPSGQLTGPPCVCVREGVCMCVRVCVRASALGVSLSLLYLRADCSPVAPKANATSRLAARRPRSTAHCPQARSSPPPAAHALPKVHVLVLYERSTGHSLTALPAAHYSLSLSLSLSLPLTICPTAHCPPARNAH